MALTPPVSPTARDFASVLADIEQRLSAIEVGLRTGQLGNSSLENSGLNAYDNDGNLRYTVGLQEDGNYTSISMNNPNPPPVPSQAVVIPGKGTLTVRYEGETADGIGLPTDWQNANVYLAPPSGTYTKVGTIISVPGDFIVGDLEYQTYSVRLSNVNYSGKESAQGAPTTGTPVQVVGQDLLDGIVSEVKLAGEAVTAVKVAANAIGTGKIQDGAVDLSKLGDGSVSASKIIDGAVQSGKIAASAVGANEIAANSIVSGNIATDAIEARNVLAGAIQAGKIAVDAVQAGNIVAGSVTSEKIAALNITGDKIAANAIDAGKINAGSITASKLQSDLVIATRIIAGDATGARVEIHPTAGLQAFTGTGVKTVWIDSATGNITATGTFASGYTGERIVILQDGSMRFYQSSGTGYAQISNNVADLVFRGYMDSSNRSGRMNLNSQGAAMNFSSDADISANNIRAELLVKDRQIYHTSPNHYFRLNGKLSSVDGAGSNVRFSALNGSGAELSASVLFYQISGSNEAWLQAPNGNAGWKLSASTCQAVDNTGAAFVNCNAKAFNAIPSSRLMKRDEAEILFAGEKTYTPLDVVKECPAYEWTSLADIKGRGKTPGFQLHHEVRDENNNPVLDEDGRPKIRLEEAVWTDEEPEVLKHYGPMVEDLQKISPRLVYKDPSSGQMGLDIRDIGGVNWAATGQLTKIVEELQARIETLEADRTSRVVDGEVV